jgi:hypothetical protein
MYMECHIFNPSIFNETFLCLLYEDGLCMSMKLELGALHLELEV